MTNFARPLHLNDLAFTFLRDALDFSEADADLHCVDVMKAERLLQSMVLKSTLESEENRRPLFKSDDRRANLRRQIFDELINNDRLDDDEDIRLEKGGARPKGGPVAGLEATILIGLPASGKSSIAGRIADQTGAFVVDSDFAKRKIPEFPQEFGASIVHEESSLVTFGSLDPKYAAEFNLFEYCIAKRFNMVIPKIGSKPMELQKLRDSLIEQGYAVHLVLVSLDRQEACRRALLRYSATKRYVPLGLIFDGYGNEPILTYYRIKEQAEWKSVAKISSEKLRENGPQIIFRSENSPIKHLQT